MTPRHVQTLKPSSIRMPAPVTAIARGPRSRAKPRVNPALAQRVGNDAKSNHQRPGNREPGRLFDLHMLAWRERRRRERVSKIPDTINHRLNHARDKAKHDERATAYQEDEKLARVDHLVIIPF